MAGFPFSILVSLLIGVGVTSLLRRRAPKGVAEGTLTLCISWAVGHGLTSCLLFLWLLVYGSVARAYVLLEVVVAAALMIALLRGEKSRQPPKIDLHPRPFVGGSWWVGGAFTIACLAMIAAVSAVAIQFPHGGWDTWAIYGGRARAIFRGGPAWRDAFSPLLAWSHPGYPLLHPLSLVRAWIYCGREVVSVPTITTVMLTGATISLLVSALSVLRGRVQGWLGGLVLLTSTTLLLIGGSGLSDMPLVFLCLATVVLLALWRERGGDAHLVLAGITAGLAAWTKNEGLLFVVAVTASVIAVSIHAEGVRAAVRRVGALAAGLLPVLTVVMLFKTLVAPPSELVSAMMSESALEKLADAGRYRYLLRELTRHAVPDGSRALLAALLAAYLACMGRGRVRAGAGPGAIALLPWFAGYMIVYLTTPYDLPWHFQTSIDRILLQMWPCFVLVFFLYVARPLERTMNDERLLAHAPSLQEQG